MEIKHLITIQSLFLVILIFGNPNLVKAQDKDNSKECAVTNNIFTNDFVKVSSKELNKRIIFISDLYAPPTATLTKIKDKTVVIDVFVDKEGKVIRAIISRGHPALTAVGSAIAYKAQFTPLKIDNKPTNMCGKLILNWNPKKLDELNE